MHKLFIHIPSAKRVLSIDFAIFLCIMKMESSDLCSWVQRQAFGNGSDARWGPGARCDTV